MTSYSCLGLIMRIIPKGVRMSFEFALWKLLIILRHSSRLWNCNLKDGKEPYIFTGPSVTSILHSLVWELRGYEPWLLYMFVWLFYYFSQVLLWHIVSWNLIVVLHPLELNYIIIGNMNCHIMSVFGFYRAAAGGFYKPLRNPELWHSSSCSAAQSCEAFKSKQRSCRWITLKNRTEVRKDVLFMFQWIFI